MVLGPMARSVEDLSLTMEILARPDARESEVPPIPWRQAPRPKMRDLRIAWTSSFPGTIIAPEIRTAVESLANELDRQGARLEECRPSIDLNEQDRFLGQLVGILVGALADPPATLADYFAALQKRDGFIATWEQFFEDWDVFLCPVYNVTAHRYTEDVVTVDGNELVLAEMYSPIVLSPATGVPAVVVPLARDSKGLPMGVQLIGRRWDDERLLAIAGLISEITGGFHRPPGY